MRRQIITKRKAARMTQTDLAGAMGVSQGYVAQYESGAKAWPSERIEQASTAISQWETEHPALARETYLQQFRNIIDGFNANGWPEGCQ